MLSGTKVRVRVTPHDSWIPLISLAQNCVDACIGSTRGEPGEPTVAEYANETVIPQPLIFAVGATSNSGDTFVGPFDLALETE